MLLKIRGLELLVILLLFTTNDIISTNFEVFNCVNIADNFNE